MAQGFKRLPSQVAQAADLRQTLGYVPGRTPRTASGSGVTYNGSTNSLSLAPIADQTLLGNISGSTATPYAIPYSALTTFWIPLVTGAEPVQLVSDGAGQLVLVGWTP